jgi:urease accessory protein
MNTLSQIRWLQLCSSQLPVGAFAYSQGLEQAVERGWVSTTAELETWLGGLLQHTLARTDLPALAHAWQLWHLTDVASDVIVARARRQSEHVLALRESSELRQEERRLGSALARVLHHLGILRAESFVGSASASYLVMVGLAAAEWQIDQSQTLTGHAFTWLQNQLSVACRLLPLGQLEAQALLARLSTLIPPSVQVALTIPEDEIGIASPALALASAWHEQQYTRLFRS